MKEGNEPDILLRLMELHKQATEERSHYYVGKCVRDAAQEIAFLRMVCREAGINPSELNVHTMAAGLAMAQAEKEGRGKKRTAPGKRSKNA
jgi:hypothetical protein